MKSQVTRKFFAAVSALECEPMFLRLADVHDINTFSSLKYLITFALLTR
jgi:hypothetical protein